MRNLRKISLLMALIGTAILLVLLVQHQFREARQKSHQLALQSHSQNLDLGGAYQLTDQFGKTRHSDEFLGKYQLIYFGFTYCPDVCPLSLQIMTNALMQMGAQAAHIQPLFITIDPARDTVDEMRQYMSYFDKRFIGLTGSETEIDTVTKTFRVYARKIPDPEQAGAYTMDHSSFFYLMGPDGTFATHFDHQITADALAERLTDIVGAQ